MREAKINIEIFSICIGLFLYCFTVYGVEEEFNFGLPEGDEVAAEFNFGLPEGDEVAAEFNFGLPEGDEVAAEFNFGLPEGDEVAAEFNFDLPEGDEIAVEFEDPDDTEIEDEPETVESGIEYNSIFAEDAEVQAEKIRREKRLHELNAPVLEEEEEVVEAFEANEQKMEQHLLSQQSKALPLPQGLADEPDLTTVVRVEHHDRYDKLILENGDEVLQMKAPIDNDNLIVTLEDMKDVFEMDD